MAPRYLTDRIPADHLISPLIGFKPNMTQDMLGLRGAPGQWRLRSSLKSMPFRVAYRPLLDRVGEAAALEMGYCVDA